MSDKGKIVQFPITRRDSVIVEHEICDMCPKNGKECKQDDEVCFALELIVALLKERDTEDFEDVLDSLTSMVDPKILEID